MEPMTNCPPEPMFHSCARKAMEMPKPMSRMGTSFTSTSQSFWGEPKAPLSMAA
jgi:hypothetical protein